MDDCLVAIEDLQQHTKETFGAGYMVKQVTNRHGGAQKTVYKVKCTNGFMFMLYVWELAMNYFQEEIERLPENERIYGCGLFEGNQAFLSEHGIRTPGIYYINKERERYPFDFAFVEYIDGPDAASFLNADEEPKEKVFGQLGSMLARMHSLERDYHGKINDGFVHSGKCHMQELEQAEQQLAYASDYIAAFKENQMKLLEKVHELASKIEERERYSFIHGELGPDHVMVNDKLEPYLNDIEGSRYYDSEYEHSFLTFRFGAAYSYLDNDRLDRNRMLFYKMYHHLSCTAGGLKLLHRGFPNRQLAMDITRHNYRSALKFIDISIDGLE